ncbi:MAG: hypothetical protein P1P85_01935 [Patescibacteria group bacterium]|nr:hypothetical protein [Patescibacteria group bacterium]
MIKINLLSPDDKQKLKWEKINHFVMTNFLVVLFSQFFIVVIFVAVVQYLMLENDKIKKELESIQTVSEAKEINMIKNGINTYKKQSRFFYTIRDNRVYWVNVLEKFSYLVPSGVMITNISIAPKDTVTVSKKNAKEEPVLDKNNDKLDVNIMGVSKTIDDLLIFENNLKSSDIFVDFKIDPRNYDSENFRYVLSISKDNLVFE